MLIRGTGSPGYRENSRWALARLIFFGPWGLHDVQAQGSKEMLETKLSAVLTAGQTGRLPGLPTYRGPGTPNQNELQSHTHVDRNKDLIQRTESIMAMKMLDTKVTKTI